MKRVQYSIYKRETGSAGGKAKNDASDILESLGFTQMYKPSNYRLIRVIQQFLSILKLSKNDILFFQYPTTAKTISRFLQKKIKKYNNTICLVHDISSIQGMGNVIEEEINFLNSFKYVIVHNNSMKQFLVEKGCNSRLFTLGFFDYLVESEFENKLCSTNTICFAGNLDKSSFVSELNSINQYTFNLYGIKNTVKLPNSNNIVYQGLFPSTEIMFKLDGEYGLVWDGDSLDDCSNIHGKYLLYNCPHKASLYILAGKPIITWKQAAIADLVTSYNIGIVVDSLKQLDTINLKENYPLYKQNVMLLRKKIKSGWFLRNVIEDILQIIEK